VPVLLCVCKPFSPGVGKKGFKVRGIRFASAEEFEEGFLQSQVLLPFHEGMIPGTHEKSSPFLRDFEFVE
jgi:hypothetical protein